MISIVMPVYNCERFVGRAVESVLKQNVADWELIAVDDGSTDGSLAVLRRYSDPRVKLLSQRNQGVCAARNHGLSVAKGEIIALLDADDEWCPGKLEKHLAAFERHPEAGVVVDLCEYMDEDGGRTGFFSTGFPPVLDARNLMIHSFVCSCSSVSLRRKTLEQVKVGGVDGSARYFDSRFRICGDYDLWLRILLTTDWRFVGVPESLTYYRLRRDALTVSDSDWRQVSDALRTVKDLADRSGSPELQAAFQVRLVSSLLYYAAKHAVTGSRREAIEFWIAAARNGMGPMWACRTKVLATVGAIAVSVVLPRSKKTALWMVKARRFLG